MKISIDEKQFTHDFIVIAISISLSALVTFYLVTSHIGAKMSGVSPFVIGGYAEIDKQINGRQSEADVKAAYDDMTRLIELARRNGYVVIDEKAVLLAPKNMYLPVKQIPNKEHVSMDNSASHANEKPKKGMTIEDVISAF